MQTEVSSPSTMANQIGDGEVAGKAQRRNKIIYWTLTLILFLPATAERSSNSSPPDLRAS